VTLQQLVDLTAEAKAIMEEMDALIQELQKKLGKCDPFAYRRSPQLGRRPCRLGYPTDWLLHADERPGVRRSFTVQLRLSFSPAGTSARAMRSSLVGPPASVSSTQVSESQRLSVAPRGSRWAGQAKTSWSPRAAEATP
jgi:hypothetical protein